MFSARFVTVFGLAATVGFIVANCGGSDSSSNSNGLNCPATNGGVTCNAEQTKAYGDCLQSKCDTAFQGCYGAGYKSGSFSGACGTWIGCYAKCSCDKTCQAMCGAPPAECLTCISAQVSPCVTSSGCVSPTCTGTGTGGSGGGGSGGASGTGGSGAGGAGGGGGGGGGTCADLTKCCNSLADANQKATCNMAVMASMSAGGDFYCGQVLMVYKASGVCK
jgi:hypothetical protein